MHQLVIRKAMLSEIPAIKAIADANKDTLGFVTRPALQLSIEKGWLLIAENEEGIVGFVNYRHRRDEQTTIYELCVSQSQRNQGIGYALVQGVKQEAIQQNKAFIQLKAVTAIPANDFYWHIGFILGHVEVGRKRALNVWRLMIIKGCLFS